MHFPKTKRGCNDSDLLLIAGWDDHDVVDSNAPVLCAVAVRVLAMREADVDVYVFLAENAHENLRHYYTIMSENLIDKKWYSNYVLINIFCLILN